MAVLGIMERARARVIQALGLDPGDEDSFRIACSWTAWESGEARGTVVWDGKPTGCAELVDGAAVLRVGLSADLSEGMRRVAVTSTTRSGVIETLYTLRQTRPGCAWNVIDEEVVSLDVN